MPSTDETGQSSERLFRLYTEGSDGAAGRRWVMLVVGIFVAICLAACVIVLMRSGQYDDMVRRLQPYMSADTVVSELGQPKGRFRGTLPGLALLGETPELQALGVPAGAGMTMIYHAPGANGPLILVFADTGTPYIDRLVRQSLRWRRFPVGFFVWQHGSRKSRRRVPLRPLEDGVPQGDRLTTAPVLRHGSYRPPPSLIRIRR